MEERRKHQRFKLGNTCIVNHSEVVGTVIDISMGGLSCNCLEQNRCLQGAPQEVDIYCRIEGLWAKRLPVRKVASENIPGKFAKEFATRICRLQFAELPKEQKAQVENIILQSSLL